MGKKLFIGTFVHSLGLKDLEVVENSAIGIEGGKIVFFEKAGKNVNDLVQAHGFEGAEVF
jgi:hypothetical protein